MNNNISNLKNILNSINMKNFNFNNINHNIDLLTNIFSQLKNNYSKLNNINPTDLPFTKINSGPEYKKIFTQINNYVSMANSKKLSDFVSNSTNLIKINFSNTTFYYIYDSESKLNHDINQIYSMLRISLALNQYCIPNDNVARIIIWIPIDTNRDFEHNSIDNKKLKKSSEEYKGFTVSGVTHGLNPRYTIVTRYEEVAKLLLHELIHNFYLDGSNFHSQLKNIIKDYIKIKNNPNSKIKNYNYEFSIYESYTELLGTYLYLLFENINLSESDLKNKLIGQICSEILYSYNTIANLAKLNNLNTWEQFINSQSFLGNICIYEYYYLKGLMYNNFLLVLPKNMDEFIQMYKEILNLIKNSSNDKLLADIFNYSVPQSNYKYILN